MEDNLKKRENDLKKTMEDDLKKKIGRQPQVQFKKINLNWL